MRVDPRWLTNVWYLALTIWAEARGEGRRAMELVAWVVRNRVESPRFPDTYPDAVTQRYQFSAWNPNDPNRPKLADPLGGPPADDRAWFTALEIAQEVIDAPASANPLPGVYHYHDTSIETPAWARGMEPVRFPDVPRIVFLRERRAA